MLRKVSLVLCSLVMALSPFLFGAIDFFPNEHTVFYVEKTSVCAPSLKMGEWWKLLLYPFTGQTVRYNGNQIEETMQKLNAEVLFVEEACGIVHYYCSANTGKSVILYGKEVNLEIAYTGESTNVGIPILFSSY